MGNKLNSSTRLEAAGKYNDDEQDSKLVGNKFVVFEKVG
jgi:hypothetical protein